MKVETFINDIVDSMTKYLNDEQLRHLKDVLYIKCHDIDIVDTCTDIVPEGIDGNEMKLKMFIMSKKAENIQDRTLKQYAREIRHLTDFIGKAVEDITSMDIRYYLGVLREKHGVGMSSIQTRLWYFSSYWDFLVNEGLVNNNPTRKIGPIKVEKTIKKPFTAEEMEALRINCKNLRDRAIVEFLYSTGVRVSELVNLNVGDVKFGDRELIVYGKESKERKTYLTDGARFYLNRYIETRDDDDLNSKPLFVSLKKPHKRLTVSGVQYMLRKLGEHAGVEDVHPHRFRRTIATDLLSRGMPIEQVKVFLGHEKLDTTLIYCAVSDEQVKFSHKKYA